MVTFIIGSRGSIWRTLSRTDGVSVFGGPVVRNANVAERNGDWMAERNTVGGAAPRRSL